MKNISYKNIDRIILFGGSRLAAVFASEIAKRKFCPLLVISSKRHLKEIINHEGETLEELLSAEEIPFYESRDVNTDKRLAGAITKETLGIALGAAWVFSEKTARLFSPEYFLDFMGIDLPRYRGGAHYTWQILHQNRVGVANLQIIKGGEKTFHKGDIIKRVEYRLPSKAGRPIDYFDFILKEEMLFLSDFLKEIKERKPFPVMALNEEKRSYYPFLSSKENGFINWSWSSRDIWLFISAFDEPYCGATTFIHGKRIFLKDCALLPAEEPYHPFTSGLIIRKENNRLHVAAVGGILSIGTILDEGAKNTFDIIKEGDRLYTPSEKIDGAMTFNAVYTSAGLKKSNKNKHE